MKYSLENPDIFNHFMRFPEKCQRALDGIYLWNYSPTTYACFLDVRWRPGHLEAEQNGRTFYQNQRARGDLRKMKYNRSLPVHVKTKWKLKFISAIPYAFLFYFPTSLPPPHLPRQPSSVRPIKTSFLRGNLFHFENKCPTSPLCLWAWRRTQEDEETRNKTPPVRERHKHECRFEGSCPWCWNDSAQWRQQQQREGSVGGWD